MIDRLLPKESGQGAVSGEERRRERSLGVVNKVGVDVDEVVAVAHGRIHERNAVESGQRKALGQELVDLRDDALVEHDVEDGLEEPHVDVSDLGIEECEVAVQVAQASDQVVLVHRSLCVKVEG